MRNSEKICTFAAIEKYDGYLSQYSYLRARINSMSNMSFGIIKTDGPSPYTTSGDMPEVLRKALPDMKEQKPVG